MFINVNGVTNGKVDDIFVLLDQEVHVMYESIYLTLGKIVVQDGMVCFNKYDLNDLEYDELGRVLIDSVYAYAGLEVFMQDFMEALHAKHSGFLNKKSIIDYFAIMLAFMRGKTKLNQYHQMYYEKLCMMAGNMLQTQFISLNASQYAAFEDISKNHNYLNIFMGILNALGDNDEPCFVQAAEHYHKQILQKMIEQYELGMQNVGEPSPLVLLSKGSQEPTVALQDKQESPVAQKELHQGASFKLS